ncbi:hypothetical protein BC834DRAFT_808348, partial [Gloeopeniophorella convolvens]
DMIQDALSQLESGTSPDEIHLETSLPVLRNRSVRWLVEAHKAVNKPDIVQKVCSIFSIP